MTKEERLQLQREKLAHMRVREDQLRAEGYKYIAGVDEVGRGPLAGPVVTAAVVLPADFDVLGIDDSKKLSEKKREELFDIIMERAVAVGIGEASEKIIDEINILRATKMAMKQAVEECDAKLKAAVTINGQEDGIDYVLFDAMKIDEIEKPQESIIKGDANVLAIAAASIIAKVTRDRMMVKYDEQYPGYAFAKNKGYGTKAHYEGLHAQGMCPIHRKTFLKNLAL